MSNEASENVNLNFKNAVKYILPSGLDCEKSMHSRARANKSMPLNHLHVTMLFFKIYIYIYIYIYINLRFHSKC
jgi:hypothetical protein